MRCTLHLSIPLRFFTLHSSIPPSLLLSPTRITGCHSHSQDPCGLCASGDERVLRVLLYAQGCGQGADVAMAVPRGGGGADNV